MLRRYVEPELRLLAFGFAPVFFLCDEEEGCDSKEAEYQQPFRWNLRESALCLRLLQVFGGLGALHHGPCG